MTPNLEGKLKLLAALLFFGAWCWISTQHELRLEAKLEATQRELEQKARAHEITLESLQKAHEGRDQVRNEIREKQAGLTQALDIELDWSGIAIPDDILDRLRERACANPDSLLPPCNPSGGYSDSIKGQSQNCRGYGKAADSGRGSDAPEKRGPSGAAGIQGQSSGAK